MTRNEKQLVSELESYIQNGYLDIGSFDNPDDEAATALTELHFKNEELCKIYCKLILESPDVGDSFLDAICLSHLFDLDKEYSLDYTKENIQSMPAPLLRAVMDGLYQYGNTDFKTYFTPELINKINRRYEEITTDDFYKGMLRDTYKMFSDVFRT